MKNTMKRIMCMMIAVMLLISAVPAAFAAGEVTLVVKIDDESVFNETVSIKGDSATVSDLLKHKASINVADYDFSHAQIKGNGTNIGLDGVVENGKTVYVGLYTKKDDTDTDPGEEDKKDDTTTETVEPIHVVVKVNESDKVVKEFDKIPANGKDATVENLLSYGWNKDWTNVYSFDHAWNSTQQKDAYKSSNVNAGDLLYIMLRNDEEPEAEKDEDTTTGSSTNNGTANGNVYTFNYDSANKGKTYTMRLHIFLNRNTSTAHKTVTLNLAKDDDQFLLSDAISIVEARYDAVDTDEGIEYDGLYVAEGDWLSNYAADKRYDRIEGLVNARSNQYVNLYIVIDNAKVESSSAVDSSNPKTGDSIMIAVSTMALAGAALVSVMELKKRKMI